VRVPEDIGSAPTRSVARRGTGRWFYAGLAAVLVVLIAAGFTPTFYARGAFFPVPPLRRAVAAHGVAFTIWISLFLIQPWLIALGRRRLHRRLGVLAGLVAAATVVLGVIVSIGLEQQHAGESGAETAVHLFSNLAPLAIFAGFVCAGILVRHVPEVHKRCMVLATVVLLPAATGRLFADFGVDFLNLPVYAVFAFACAVYDRLAFGRIHRVSLYGGLLLVGTDLLVSALLAMV
jgi:hypothetical protein